MGSLTGKGKELVNEMKRRRIDIMGIQETKWEGNLARILGDRYKVIYSGEVKKRNGVGVIVAEKWTKGVVSMNRVRDRLMAVKPSEGELLVVCGDLNGHVGKESGGFEEVHRGYGYGNRNRERRSILEMAQQRELVVVQKKEEHLITFSSGDRCRQIDYILVNKKGKEDPKKL